MFCYVHVYVTDCCNTERFTESLVSVFHLKVLLVLLFSIYSSHYGQDQEMEILVAIIALIFLSVH